MTTGYSLAVLLTFAVLTLWVGERWVLSALEAGVYLGACATIVVQRGRISYEIAVLAPALMCVWAAIQWTAHWSATPSATADAWLYWLAAFCFALIGSQVDRGIFLKTALTIGTVVCVAGTIQLFTSPGNVFWLFASGFDRRVIGPFVSPNNYAAFVELLIPIALSRRRPAYLLVAAALTATVVASGSRAGAVLALLEIAAVAVLQRWNRRAWFAFAVLTAALSLIVGAQFLASRLTQKEDVFAVRREFLYSSVAMFRAQPLHGFGLGTWPYAYPRFALLDIGETANHAHNEWAQWAAEGGAPALAIMLGLLFWTVRPAVRSIWGIGILAVFAHSLVDYPFLRLGLAAWIFAFLGVLSSRVKPRRSVPAAAAIPVLLLGAWYASKLAYADALYRRATLSSVQRAATLAPDRAAYQVLLAQLDSSHAAAHLERALAANPCDTRARIALAQERENAGDRSAAARLLLEASRYDHQFAPAWALANFYFRTGESGSYRLWEQRAAAMSYGDRRAFFDLCFLASGDAHTVFERVVAQQPRLQLPFLNYLVFRHRIADAVEVAEQLALSRQPAAPDAVQVNHALDDYVDAAIEAGETTSAWRIQGQLAVARPLLVNGDFAGPLSNRGFDWKAATAEGIGMARTQDHGPVLSIELSGSERESCELLSHVLVLEPGASYIMRFDYRTVDFPTHTGVSWQLGDEIAGIEAAVDWKHEEWRFQATDARSLELVYRRTPGGTRAEGRLFLRNARIDRAPL